MRQHVVKVGWLLTHDQNTALIFYCAAFLPGVTLRAALVWLGMRILRAKDMRLQLPRGGANEPLPPGFLLLLGGAHPLKRLIIELLPVLAGLTALWLIATYAIDVSAALALTYAGGVDAIGRGIARLTGASDFWLWIYLAFTLSNILLSQPPKLSQRGGVLSVAFVALICVGTALALGALLDVSSLVDGLLRGLALLFAFATGINLALALALGTIEAVIERITGHNATFHDGAFVAVKRDDAPAEKRRENDASALERRKALNAPRSLLELPLPLPGPPGVEPVSKPVAAVHAAPAPKHQTVAKARDPIVEKSTRRRASASPKQRARKDAPASDEVAPFSRPFVAAPFDDDEWDDEPGDRPK